MKGKYVFKKIKRVLGTGFFLLILTTSSALACEIDIVIQDGEKSSYQVGDTVVLEVKVFLTHRNCPEGIEATKYKLEGLKALGATKWKLISGSTFQRKIKVQITDGAKAVFHAVRTCDKEGGYGFYTFNIKN